MTLFHQFHFKSFSRVTNIFTGSIKKVKTTFNNYSEYDIDIFQETNLNATDLSKQNKKNPVISSAIMRCPKTRNLVIVITKIYKISDNERINCIINIETVYDESGKCWIWIQWISLNPKSRLQMFFLIFFKIGWKENYKEK